MERQKGEIDMKIAITATGASLDARLDPRFGRCPCFLIIDTDSMNFEAVENPNAALGGGAQHLLDLVGGVGAHGDIGLLGRQLHGKGHAGVDSALLAVGPGQKLLYL